MWEGVDKDTIRFGRGGLNIQLIDAPHFGKSEWVIAAGECCMKNCRYSMKL